jgi:hypothetical protein
MATGLPALMERLEDEHAALRPLLDRLEQAALGDGLAALIDEARAILGPELDAHIAAEDTELFPDGLFLQWIQEHDPQGPCPVPGGLQASGAAVRAGGGPRAHHGSFRWRIRVTTILRYIQ